MLLIINLLLNPYHVICNYGIWKENHLANKKTLIIYKILWNNRNLLLFITNQLTMSSFCDISKPMVQVRKVQKVLKRFSPYFFLPPRKKYIISPSSLHRLSIISLFPIAHSSNSLAQGKNIHREEKDESMLWIRSSRAQQNP